MKKMNKGRFSNNRPTIKSLELPSRGLQYPDGYALSYTPFTYGDILEFNTSRMTEVQMLNFILDGIVAEGMNKKDITYFDFIFIGWQRKIATFGTEIDMSTGLRKSITLTATSSCPNCQEDNQLKLDLTDLDFTDTEIENLPLKEKVSFINAEGNTEEIELEFKFITIGEYIEIKQMGYDDSIALLAKSVTNIDFEKAYDILYNAIGEDVQKLEKISSNLKHGLKSLIYCCQECGFTYESDIMEDGVVLKPFRGQE